jgi:GT2 family glycosyltransferase
MNPPDVTIIIVSWNTREILRDCLRSVYENAGALDFETIVVDNASADGSAQMVARDFPQVQLVINADNRGFAAANNQGMTLARGRYVLLLNSDTVVLDRALEKTVAFAEAHPEAAVVGCRVLNPDRTWQRTCSRFPSALNLLLSSTYLYKLFPKSRFWGREFMLYWDRSDVREVDVVSGSFMLVRREAIERVGMMDEAFFMYAEETDWCYRFHQAGYKALFTPAGSIVHLGGASSRQAASKMRLQLSASILYFLKKHKSRGEYILGCLFTALFFLVRAPIWWVKGCLSRRERSHAWRVARIYITGAAAVCRGYEGLCVARRWEPNHAAPSSPPATPVEG